MIVICTKCQAKFRVADDKIGARGAKMRCSRCKTVFLVRRGPAADAAGSPLAAAPGPGAALDLGFRAAPPAEDPSSAAAAAHRVDPFAGADPFAPPAEPPAPTLPVTDLSDLLAPAISVSAQRPPSVPPPLPPPLPVRSARSASAAPEMRPPPTDLVPAFDGPGADAAPALERAPGDVVPASSAAALDPPWASAPSSPLGAAASGDAFAPEHTETPEPSESGGLALEDRLTPPPVRAARGAAPGVGLDFAPAPPFDAAPDFDFEFDASRDPFAPAAQQFVDYAPEPGGDALALAGDPAARLGGPGPGGPAPDGPAAYAPAPVDGPKPSPRRAAPAPDERIPRRRRSRLRAVAVNAVALAALLLAAGAILAVWRTEGPIDAGALRPAALLAALGRGPAHGAFDAHDIRSGAYERERAAPLLFVRGKVVSRAPGPVAAVRVSVAVVRAGQVLARGEAIAGAVPTAEELFSAGDDAALARAAAAARARAPARVKPGDSVPFLVTIADAPSDLEGAAIRLDIAAAGGATP